MTGASFLPTKSATKANAVTMRKQQKKEESEDRGSKGESDDEEESEDYGVGGVIGSKAAAM